MTGFKHQHTNDIPLWYFDGCLTFPINDYALLFQLCSQSTTPPFSTFVFSAFYSTGSCLSSCSNFYHNTTAYHTWPQNKKKEGRGYSIEQSSKNQFYVNCSTVLRKDLFKEYLKIHRYTALVGVRKRVHDNFNYSLCRHIL